MNVENNLELFKKLEQINLRDKHEKIEEKIIYRLPVISEKLDIVRISRDSTTNRYKYMIN